MEHFKKNDAFIYRSFKFVHHEASGQHECKTGSLKNHVYPTPRACEESVDRHLEESKS